MDEINDKLIQACINGKIDIVKNLVENKADITVENNELLTVATCHGHFNIVKFLVENKADISAQNYESVRWGSYHGYLDIVKFLVENKADISTKDNWSVKFASYRGHLEVTKFLLSLGADYSKVNSVMQIKLLQDKYFRKWRKIVLKRFICKVITPLYYASGFKGAEKEKILMEGIFNSDNQLNILI